ncbi:MAG: type II toxin-antitoxin system PemK/MazF family toxin [Acidobacteriota bacterium]
MRQYEIWWANLPAPAGPRPVLLLTRSSAYTYLNKFVAAEITSTIRDIPVELHLGPKDGLPDVCAANFDNLRTVAKISLQERISRLHPRRYSDVKRAMGHALAWDKLIP